MPIWRPFCQFYPVPHQSKKSIKSKVLENEQEGTFQLLINLSGSRLCV
jgi:hypothetical protein